MKAILYICHGSRVKDGQEAALAFIEATKPVVDIAIQEACFLELAQPSIAEGIAKCIERGASEIFAVPFLLLTAGHAKVDIPKALGRAMELYPEVSLFYGDALGVHAGIVDVLVKRLEAISPVSEDSTVLLVGRGSSDQVIDDYFAEIAALFTAKTNIRNVEVAYLAARGPFFEATLERMIMEGAGEVFVIPYLLFTGILMQDMARFVDQLTGTKEVHLCESLGYDEAIREVLVERVSETILRRVKLDVSSYA